MSTSLSVGTLALGGIGALVALALWLARRLLAPVAATNADTLVDAVDALLPQTQCGQCGHPGCRPYAQAVVAGAPLDRCPPGGPDTAAALGELLGRIDAHDSLAEPEAIVARIDPARCIGCALCLDACPVDAIAGASKYLHAILPEHCTGCELCVPACPVDCIDMVTREGELAPPNPSLRSASGPSPHLPMTSRRRMPLHGFLRRKLLGGGAVKHGAGS